MHWESKKIMWLALLQYLLYLVSGTKAAISPKYSSVSLHLFSPLKKEHCWEFPLWWRGTNPTSIHENAGSVPGLAQWVGGSGVAMSCGVGCRHSSDPALLWLCCRVAATALFWPGNFHLPKKQNNNNNKKQKKDIVSQQRFIVFCVHILHIFVEFTP